MEAEVFLKEWNRMCRSFCGNERNCPVTLGCGEVQCRNCRQLAMAGGDIIKIVQEWSDSHPAKTRLSVFLEAFPKAEIGDNGYPQSCAGYIFGFDCSTRSDDDCMECWNTPVEE